MVGPLYFIATLCDVTVLTNRALHRLGRDHAIDVYIHIIAYADDISAFIVADSEAEIQLAVNVLMDEFFDYFTAAGLCMNPEKSELILFRRGRKSETIFVGGQEEAEKIKLLGVVIDKNYTFASHAVQVAASVNQKVEKLSTVIRYMDWKNKMDVTEAIILSTVTYCLAVWGWKYEWRKKVQKALNNAVRMLLGGNDRMSITDGLQRLGWLNMDNIWRLEQVLAMRRICSTQIPELMFNIITAATNHRYMVRADGIRSSWWPRNSHGENAFMNLAMKTFNELRVPQRCFFNTLENRNMTKSEIRSELKHDLIVKYGNDNLH